jgi:hypothetical protein
MRAPVDLAAAIVRREVGIVETQWTPLRPRVRAAALHFVSRIHFIEGVAIMSKKLALALFAICLMAALAVQFADQNSERNLVADVIWG